MIREIPGWPGYAVTDSGAVISFWGRRWVGGRGPGRGALALVTDDGRELPTFDRKNRNGEPTGYRSVCLSRGGRSRNLYVHELVLLAFVGPRPSPDHEALHGNGQRDDNRLTNLRWGTVQENAADRERHGHVHRGDAWYRARGLPPPCLRTTDQPEREVEASRGPFDDLL